MDMRDQANRLRNKLSDVQKKGKTIAIVSGKGGVGKSNTVLNVAIALQQRGKKVLIIDLDVGMGNIDILIGSESKCSIVHLFNEFMPLHDIIEVGPCDVSYIAGGTSLNELLQLDDTKLDFFFEQYEQIVYEYDYIFLDLGAGVSESSMAFILASDECFVVTTPEPTSIMDAYSMMKHIVIHDEAKPMYVVMNRCYRAREGRKTLEKFDEIVQRFLNVKVIKLGIIPYDRIVEKAVIAQTPYILYDKRSTVARAISNITHNYLNNSENVQHRKRMSFVDRLKRLIKTR